MFTALYKYKDVIEKKEVMETYGFLTKGYRAEYFYWELITIQRKSILVIMSVFFDFSPFAQVYNINLLYF